MASLLVQPESDIEARLVLESMGCEQRASVQLTTRLLPFLIVSVTSILLYVIYCFGRELARNGLKIEAATVIVAATAVFAILQWRVSLEKDALEKYQTEIKEANESKLKWPGVKEMMAEHYLKEDSTNPREYQQSLYVYNQLDSLEFALERYLQGFTSAYTAFRSVITFQGKCTAAQFRSRVEKLFVEGSYSPPVRSVIKEVLRRTAA